ncbi:hypothetical protein CCZ27_01655 [Thauera sinica]|nr:hypothetical protein CCZ27_01655 [Thauera sp. K11]
MACGASLALAIAATATALAAPAPWHVWRSKLDGREICKQTSAGPGWEWSRGPFHDSRCRRPIDRTERRFNWQKSSIDPSQRALRLPGRKEAGE